MRCERSRAARAPQCLGTASTPRVTPLPAWPETPGHQCPAVRQTGGSLGWLLGQLLGTASFSAHHPSRAAEQEGPSCHPAPTSPACPQPPAHLRLPRARPTPWSPVWVACPSPLLVCVQGGPRGALLIPFPWPQPLRLPSRVCHRGPVVLSLGSLVLARPPGPWEAAGCGALGWQEPACILHCWTVPPASRVLPSPARGGGPRSLLEGSREPANT